MEIHIIQIILNVVSEVRKKYHKLEYLGNNVY